MNNQLDRDTIEKMLESRVVCNVLDEMSECAIRWKGGGALNHRGVAAGYLARTGAENIAKGKTVLTRESTFKDMRELDKRMYDGTISFLEPLIQARIYSP